MSKQEDYVEIKDLESIKRALENAEIEYEEIITDDRIVVETEDGINFQFNEDGELRALFNA